MTSLGKRKLRDWPSRINNELNATSGILGVGSIAVAGTGLIFAVPVVTTMGLAFTALLTVACLYRSFPEKLHRPDEFLGLKIDDIRALERVDPTPVRIGFLGVSGAGKSTAVAHLNASLTPESVRTDDPYASIIVLPGGPVKYIALIDAAGQQYSQQFKVLDESDQVFVFLDHTSGNSDASIQDDRIEEHNRFLTQISGHLHNNNGRTMGIHFLLNKRDTWENGPDAKRLMSWFESQVNNWKIIPNISITSAVHSNFITGDNNRLIGILRRLA